MHEVPILLLDVAKWSKASACKADGNSPHPFALGGDADQDVACDGPKAEGQRPEQSGRRVHSPIAQTVERLAVNQEVRGSNPRRGANQQFSRSSVAERRLDKAEAGGSFPPAGTSFFLGVAQLVARVLWEHEAAGSKPATETIHLLFQQPTLLIMKRSMIQRRQDAERERLELCDAALRRVMRRPRPTPDFGKALNEAERGFSGEVVRDHQTWHPQMKTRDAARLRLAAARHLFALYPVPETLERIWIDDTGLSVEEVRLRRQWYVTAARGGSLYKAGASTWLTRKEVHQFLHSSAGLGFDEAFWEAVARSYTDDPAVALRIARSKIARTPRGEIEFWRGVARFFCANPVPVETIDDLCDYLAECRRRDSHYSLEGRTLHALTRRMHEWHHDIAAIERIEAMQRRAHGRAANACTANAVWSGSPLADWEWAPSSREAKTKGERYVIRQLKQAEDLVMESRAMRHCVSTYASKCISGRASIWSLRRCTKHQIDRLLTIELDPQHRAVQVRGFANRLAQAAERQVIERWAKARGIALP